MFIVNILKIKSFLLIVSLLLVLSSCVNEVHFSGINENKYQKIYENYKTNDYSKEDIINILGPPMVEEDSNNLWIYKIKKVTLEKEENGWKFMRIRVDYGNDLREEIMHLGSKRDWLIREIHFQRSKLEDAYIEMVQSKSN